jgi:hypothetical protein
MALSFGQGEAPLTESDVPLKVILDFLPMLLPVQYGRLPLTLSRNVLAYAPPEIRERTLVGYFQGTAGHSRAFVAGDHRFRGFLLPACTRARGWHTQSVGKIQSIHGSTSGYHQSDRRIEADRYRLDRHSRWEGIRLSRRQRRASTVRRLPVATSKTRSAESTESMGCEWPREGFLEPARAGPGGLNLITDRRCYGGVRSLTMCSIPATAESAVARSHFSPRR